MRLVIEENQPQIKEIQIVPQAGEILKPLHSIAENALLNSLSRINLSNNRIRTYEIGEDDVRIMVAEEMEPYK